MVYLAGDLPALYRRTIEAFTTRHSTLWPNPHLAEIWKERLCDLGSGLKMSNRWRSKQGGWFRMRNAFYTHVEDWRKILNWPGTEFINLYHGKCEEELRHAE